MIVGFLLGFILGLGVAPLIRSWLVWREHEEARREAELHERVLDRLSESAQEPDGPGEDPIRIR